ncbi:MAG: PA14 domain-containing protein [Planctomycetia bacterium]|nr:PA14 domain-containing protein [Planctomycetia bacterium]
MLKKKNWFYTLLIFIVLGGSSSVHATWYNEGVPNGSDIIMMDTGWPWQPSATYYASWNSSFNPKPNNLSFYAGFVTLVKENPDGTANLDSEEQQQFRLNSVWSFWGANEKGEPIQFIDVADNLYIRNEFGGEGLSGTVANMGGWDFIHPNKDGKNRWYTMLARVWQPEGEPEKEGKSAYMGRWIKDVQENKWHFIGYVQLPIPATSFTGNSGFIEPLTNPKAVRPFIRRLGYARKDGKWVSTNQTSGINARYVIANILPEGRHEYLSLEYSQRMDLLPRFLKGTPVTPHDGSVFTVQQPPQPVLDMPVIKSVSARGYKNQAQIHWTLAENSSPQLGFIIEVFDNPDCHGTPITVKKQALPTETHALVKWNGAQEGMAIRVTVRDVFDQLSVPMVCEIKKEKLLPQITPEKECVSGLKYEMFTKDTHYPAVYHNHPIQSPKESHIWLKLEELKDGKLFRQGVSRGLDTSILEERNKGFALRYTGIIKIPADGIYLFKGSVDGAYELKIDGVPILTRNEQKGTKTHFGSGNFQAGFHHFELTWLFDALAAKNFALKWSGPDFDFRPMNMRDLFYLSEDLQPKVVIQTKSLGGGHGHVQAEALTTKHSLKKLTLYLSGLQLAESSSSRVEYTGPLPKGKNVFTVRMIYDENNTVDSEPVLLEISSEPTDKTWNVNNIGPQDAHFGLYQTDSDGEQGHAFSFFGNGMHAVTREMSGDFAVSCRVDSWNGANREPVNNQSWVGVAAFQNIKNLNWRWGSTYYLVQRIRDRRTSPDYSDLGGSRVSNAVIPFKDKPWIRIQRSGNLWTSWISADGSEWELASAQILSAPQKMSAGLFFASPAQKARAHYFATVSHLRTETEARLPFPEPIPVTGTSGIRYTGVVTAHSNPQIFVVRSTDGNLLHTTNNGMSFNTIPITPVGIRSVGIHPKNPDIMLCAWGNGTKETSGLWKTTDGGKTWNPLDFPGNFDGTGPSALCGEVIQFDLRDPQKIYVGSESKGLFYSEDGGKTWRLWGLSENRITAVTQWRFESYFPAMGAGKTHLLITTCPDKWMKYLGRGDVKIPVKGTLSQVYHITEDQESFRPVYELAETGFYNAQWDKQLPTLSEFALGTSHGYMNTSGGKLSLYPFSAHLDWLRPITALGSSGRGEGKYGRFFVQALNPTDYAQISKSETWALVWKFQKLSGDVPTGGLIAVSPDWKDGEIWHYVFTDGIYISLDGGVSLKKLR